MLCSILTVIANSFCLLYLKNRLIPLFSLEPAAGLEPAACALRMRKQVTILFVWYHNACTKPLKMRLYQKPWVRYVRIMLTLSLCIMTFLILWSAIGRQSVGNFRYAYTLITGCASCNSKTTNILCRVKIIYPGTHSMSYILSAIAYTFFVPPSVSIITSQTKRAPICYVYYPNDSFKAICFTTQLYYMVFEYSFPNRRFIFYPAFTGPFSSLFFLKSSGRVKERIFMAKFILSFFSGEERSMPNLS